MSDIAQKVKQIIIDKLGVEELKLRLGQSFTNDLGADSLDTVELIMEFEKNSTSLFRTTRQRTLRRLVRAIAYPSKMRRNNQDFSLSHHFLNSTLPHELLNG